jgi:hypothetical protein
LRFAGKTYKVKQVPGCDPGSLTATVLQPASAASPPGPEPPPPAC